MRFQQTFLRSSALTFAVPAILTCAVSRAIVADETEFDNGETARLTAERLEESHLTHRPLDDELSAEWLAEFIQRLDPRRMYFLESDIDEFSAYADRLDDLTKSEDFEFPEAVRVRFQVRTSEMQRMVEEFLSGEFDFRIQEDAPRQYAEFPVDANSLRERWRQRIKLELLIEKLHGRDLHDVTEQLRGRYARIAAQAQEMTDERLSTIYLTALASRYDANSVIWSDTFLRMFEQTVSFHQYTVGLGMHERDGRMLIESVLPEVAHDTGQADLSGWEMIAIVSSAGETHDVVELHHEDLVWLILSSFRPLSKDTLVTLELLHPVTFERRSLPWYRYRY